MGSAEHLNAKGAVQASLLLFATWWLWIYTVWATNWLDPDHPGVRAMLTGVMLAGLIMSASIPEAFHSDTRGLVFAACLTTAHLLRTATVIVGVRREAVLRANFVRIFIWFLASGVLWIAGGMSAGETRTAFWVSAVVLEYLGPPAAFWVPGLGSSAVSDWQIEGAHMAERCGLFIIIALGESLLVTGATFADLAWTASTITALIAAFGAAVGMWWLYFDRTAEFASELIAHSDQPGRLGRLVYTYIHLLLIAGIILVAIGDKLALGHPTDHAELAAALTVAGGPALFLAGYILFKRAIAGSYYPSHWVALFFLLALFAAHPMLTPVRLSVGATAVLLMVSGWARFARPAVETERTAAELA